MKKLLSMMLALLVTTSLAFAQTTDKTATKTTKVTSTKKEAGSNKEAKQETTTATASTGKLKKDGTPDMRYKENKKQTTTKATK
jgi:hypothetical protein